MEGERILLSPQSFCFFSKKNAAFVVHFQARQQIYFAPPPFVAAINVKYGLYLRRCSAVWHLGILCVPSPSSAVSACRQNRCPLTGLFGRRIPIYPQVSSTQTSSPGPGGRSGGPPRENFQLIVYFFGIRLMQFYYYYFLL